MISRRSEDFLKFMDKIQTQFAQFLLKATISEKNWNEKNNSALLTAFNSMTLKSRLFPW